VSLAGARSLVLDTGAPQAQAQDDNIFDIRDIETHAIGENPGLLYLDAAFNKTPETKTAPVLAVVGQESQARTLASDTLDQFDGILAMSEAAADVLSDKSSRVTWVGRAFEQPENAWLPRKAFGLSDDRPLIVATQPTNRAARAEMEAFALRLQAASNRKPALAVLTSEDTKAALSRSFRQSAVLVDDTKDEYRASSLLNAADCIVSFAKNPDEDRYCGIAAAFGVPVFSVAEDTSDTNRASSICAKLGVLRVTKEEAVGAVLEQCRMASDGQKIMRRRKHVMKQFSFAAVGGRLLQAVQQ
jgi:hypothetical protein